MFESVLDNSNRLDKNIENLQLHFIRNFSSIVFNTRIPIFQYDNTDTVLEQSMEIIIDPLNILLFIKNTIFFHNYGICQQSPDVYRAPAKFTQKSNISVKESLHIIKTMWWDKNMTSQWVAQLKIMQLGACNAQSYTPLLFTTIFINIF